MKLSTGTKLSHYEISSQIGKGGMGEVYQATDTKLGRSVAIKVLPEEFAKDTDRVTRFQREAKLLASLNHPNIAAIYGLEESDGTNFLVMELVEGRTLDEQIKAGAIPVEEALKLALQIAEALEAAHEKGVIHRDLKPANIKVTPDGKVKVLDFGLAKAFAGKQTDLNLSNSPTLSVAATQQGMILGTAAYMSPEQARGKEVDKRADIWAFGCVLYEMVTGRQLFASETVSDTLAAIIAKEPDWEIIPEKFKLLLRHCLEKDPAKRLKDIGDVHILFEDKPESAPVQKRNMAWSIGGLLLLIGFLGAFYIFFREKPANPVPRISEIVLPDGIRFIPQSSFSLSPDGRCLVFAASDSDGKKSLWIRESDAFEARPLPGTEFRTISFMGWSPDSRYIAFGTGDRLKRTDLSGNVLLICELSSHIVGCSWGMDDIITFGLAGRGLMRVSADGGTPESLTLLDLSRRELGHNYPVFLPDKRHFLYWCSSERTENRGIYLGSLDADPEGNERRQLVPNCLGLAYVPSRNSDSAKLLFLRDEILMSQSFDDKAMELSGEAKPVASQVGSFIENGHFSVSWNDILVFRNGIEQNLQPTWFDRQGKSVGTVGKPGWYYRLSISPDENSVAASVPLISNSEYTDIWILDLLGNREQRFTLGEGHNSRPVWSHDGSDILFIWNREGQYDIYRKSSNGADKEELVYQSDKDKYPTSCAGDFLLFTTFNKEGNSDLWILPLQAPDKAHALLSTKYNEGDGHFSSDMRWIAYTSDESGRNEIYVRPFSAEGVGSWKSGISTISDNGGQGARWRKDGKELYYRTVDGMIMTVEVSGITEFRAKTPQYLFQGPIEQITTSSRAPFPVWDVTPDGEKFLIPASNPESPETSFTVVVNWSALLKE